MLSKRWCFMRNKTRLEKIERSAGSSKERVQAHLVLSPGEEITPAHEVHYWSTKHAPTTCTLEQFRRQFPEGELVIIHILYEGL